MVLGRGGGFNGCGGGGFNDGGGFKELFKRVETMSQ